MIVTVCMMMTIMMIIFSYFIQLWMTDRNLLFIYYVIFISTLLTSYPYCTFQALQQVLCLKVGDTNRLR